MTEVVTGSLVQHVSLGIGKVVAVEPTAVHIYFPHSERRYAAKLRWPAAQTFLTSAGVEPDPWLRGLSSFALDPATGRYALAVNFLSHDEAIAEFLESHPQGFAEPTGGANGSSKRERAVRWRAAHAEWTQSFGGGEGERLLADGKLRELGRRALRIAGHVGNLPGTMGQDVLVEALDPAEEVTGFFEALFGLLSAPSPARARYEKLFAASQALGVEPDLAWPMATLFPFVAEPGRHVLFLPKSTCGAATRLGCDLRYKPAPNWVTYAALQGLSAQLLEKLQARGAQDFVDVEVFLNAISKRPPSGAERRTKPAARSRSSTPARAQAASALQGNR